MGKTGMSLKLEDLSLEDIRASVYSNTKSELYDVLKKLKDSYFRLAGIIKEIEDWQ